MKALRAITFAAGLTCACSSFGAANDETPIAPAITPDAGGPASDAQAASADADVPVDDASARPRSCTEFRDEDGGWQGSGNATRTSAGFEITHTNGASSYIYRDFTADVEIGHSVLELEMASDLTASTLDSDDRFHFMSFRYGEQNGPHVELTLARSGLTVDLFAGPNNTVASTATLIEGSELSVETESRTAVDWGTPGGVSARAGNGKPSAIVRPTVAGGYRSKKLRVQVGGELINNPASVKLTVKKACITLF